MIVKVQISLMTSEDHPQALIYNRDRSVMWEGPAGALVKLMDGEPKAFFHARLVKGVINLDRQAKWQDW